MIFAYDLVNHVLNQIFHGNRSAFAREIDMEIRNFRRALNRLEAGKSSPTVLFRALAFYDKCPGLLESFAMEHMQGMQTPHGSCENLNAAREAAAILKVDHAIHAAQERRINHLMEVSQEIVPALGAALCGQNKEGYIACRGYRPSNTGKGRKNPPEMLPCEAFKRFMTCTQRAIMLPFKNKR